jgi:hypothetical protein
VNESRPNIEQWRELYAAADALKKLAPWKWMLDNHLFGVKDPASGEVGYCTVMGNLGEFFALAVYLGTEGLAAHSRIQSGEMGPGDPEVVFTQLCLMVSFEERAAQQKQDLETIKQLGLKYRGANSWPLFRSHRPGYFPWFLTRSEAVYLAEALRQAYHVCGRFRKNHRLLRAAEPGKHLVRVKGTDGDWNDEWLSPAAKQDPQAPRRAPLNEVLLEKVKGKASQGRDVWEMDFVFAPAPVQEHPDERPYFPRTLLFVDAESGAVLGTAMIGPAESCASAMTEEFLRLSQRLGLLPRRIAVSSEEALRGLESLAGALGIEVRLAGSLPMLEEAKDALYEHFGIV